jgi:hypothetical protein
LTVALPRGKHTVTILGQAVSNAAGF